MPKISIPRPTGKSIRDFHMRQSLQWAPRFKIDEEFRDLVHQKNKIETLPDIEERDIVVKEIHSGRAGGIIEHGNGLLMARPDFHAEPPSLITEDVREAEQLERAAANTFERELVLNDFWPAVGRDILIYGRAFLKAMLLQTVWTMQEGYPIRTEKETSKQYLEKIRKWKETEGKFPFIIQHIPVLSILPLLDNNDNVLGTVEVKYVTAKILAEEMNSTTVQELLSRRLLKWYDELPVIEYIDMEWVAYALAGTEPRDRARAEPLHHGNRKYQLLRTWRHGLGKHPVVLIPGNRTELQEYENHFKGFLSDAKDTLVEYDALLSRLATMIYAHYLPSYVLRLQDAASKFSGRDRPTMTINLGGVTVIMGDEVLDTLPAPSDLPDATMLLQQCDDIIQRHCAAESDIITLADGKKVTYKEVANMDSFDVTAPTDENFDKTTITKAHAYFSPPEPIYKITFESGRSIKRTGLHRIAVNARLKRHGITVVNKNKNAEWVYCKDIKQNDYILTRTKLDYKTNPETEWVDPDLALILGLVLGDGWVEKRGNAVFRNSSPQILSLFENTCNKIKQPISCGKDVIRILIGQGRGGNDRSHRPITKEMSPVLWALQELEMNGTKAGDKKLPEWAWNLTPDSAAALLRGLLLSDGCIDKYGLISFGSYSENLRNWVSDIAHRLGCPGRVGHRIDSCGKDLYEWWAFSEFVDDLVDFMGSLEGKNNEDKLYQERKYRTHRLVNEAFHREKVSSVEIEPEEVTVCVVIDKGNNHIYSPIYVEHNTLQDVLFGRVQGAAPAYQVNLRINVAKSKLSPLTQHMAIGITEVFDRFLRGIEQLGEAIVIEGERITVKMAKTYRGRLTASIQPKSPVDRSQDIGMANMAKEFGLPWDWIVEELLGIEDPATLRLMNEIQELEQLPPVKERLMQEALEQLEVLVEEEEFEESGEIDMSALPPEFAEAMQGLLAGGGEGEATPPPLGAAPPPEGGLGRGPYPPGAAPQTLAPRGLNTMNTQPQPGTPQIGEEEMVV